ncbi:MULTISPECIES: MOSC domain-containing protein [Atopobiaceae]|uniref:MOSC domain-containing protein n=1 Tax=Atopobiaceae TaxID=1643824 RepID=UPI00034E48AB|nr:MULTISPECIES: MOSC domain-containing protein [Atopobiaceae]EPD78452.1 hypothetical protein HMPREF1527_00774 [Atopobium sp. oral taxon 199 str. F0494]
MSCEEAQSAVEGTVLSCCISRKKGTRKQSVASIDLRVGEGIAGDAHAGNWHRQVSLLGNESVDIMREKGAELNPGDFAENILTSGIDLRTLPVGTVLAIGEVLLAVTQIGKTCHHDCEIRKLIGTCVMPTDGIFTVVLRGGTVKPGDVIRVLSAKEL